MLGIDTSCDDTGVGLVDNGVVTANLVASQVAMHARFGGVVPELASREHTRAIDRLVVEALQSVSIELYELDLVAATRGPGLIGALLTGFTYAKALSFALDKPFIGIHHLEGHIFAALSTTPGLQPPFLALIASGGHTHLFDVPISGGYRLLGATRDDAAGEAFDKVARLLGLGYPGGAELARLADEGHAERVPFPLPLKHQSGFDFSFSGLKTAAMRLLERGYARADIAASFQETVVESLARTVTRAAHTHNREAVVIAGGVAANRRLRERFAHSGLRTVFPPAEMNTDNGAMIALTAYHRYQESQPLTLDARAYWPLANETSS